MDNNQFLPCIILAVVVLMIAYCFISFTMREGFRGSGGGGGSRGSFGGGTHTGGSFSGAGAGRIGSGQSGIVAKPLGGGAHVATGTGYGRGYNRGYGYNR